MHVNFTMLKRGYILLKCLEFACHTLKFVMLRPWVLMKLCWVNGKLFCAGRRTKEQLGYVVECGPRMTYRVLGYCFRVQSSEYSPIHLHGRIDNFINSLQDLLVFQHLIYFSNLLLSFLNKTI